MKINKGISVIAESIKECIITEMKPEGILNDVKTFIPSYRIDEGFEEPCIWLVEHETTPVSDKKGTLTHKQHLQTPFEFVCMIYDEEDLEQSEINGRDLAGRVVLSLLKNFSRITKNSGIKFTRPVFEALYPIGFKDIIDSGDKLVATSVKLNFEYYIEWNISCKK